MSRLLLAGAVVVSFWPAAAIVLIAERLAGGRDGAPPRTATVDAGAGVDADGRPRGSGGGPSGVVRTGLGLAAAARASAELSAGRPDPALAARALTVEARLIAAPPPPAGTEAARELARATAVASAVADLATAPSVGARARLDAAAAERRGGEAP